MFPVRVRSSLWPAALLLVLCASAIRVQAQPSPTDMVGGTVEGIATQNPNPEVTLLYTVPADRYLILTDLEYSALIDMGAFGNRMETPVTLRQGNTERWSSWAVQVYVGNIELRDMVHKSFTTGVVFPTAAQVNVYHTPGATIGQGTSARWRISWTGYLSTGGLSGANQASDQGLDDLGLQLQESAPNPFQNETSIRFSLPQTGHVTLRIVDAQGRVVRALVNGPADAGRHELTWDGRDDAGRSVPGGVYFVDLLSRDGRQSRKAIAIE